MDISANQQSDDLNVDIMETGNPRDEFEEVLCEASSSSSFGEDNPGIGEEEEAQSILNKDYPLPDDGTEFLGLRKKKLTEKWRVFSQPLAWRCKWLELKIKEIQSQARMYEKEVESYYKSKEFDLDKSKLDGLDGKSIPFGDQTPRMKVFKRGTRKRVEDTTDVASYFSNHNVFSYSEKRMQANVKAQHSVPESGTARKAATRKEDDVQDDFLLYGLDSADDFLTKLLCKIDEAQERARRLRKRVDQLAFESEMPQTIDLTVQNDKQQPLITPHTAARTQTVQIGRQRISADNHTEDVLMTQDPPISIDSPMSGGFRFHTILEDMLMDEAEMIDDETEAGEEKLDYFRKLINEITGVPPEEDPTPITKKHKTSH